MTELSSDPVVIGFPFQISPKNLDTSFLDYFGRENKSCSRIIDICIQERQKCQILQLNKKEFSSVSVENIMYCTCRYIYVTWKKGA